MKLCGDINVKYLEHCTKRQLDAMLSTYYLIGNVYFLTRITNGFISARDKIFIGKTRNYTISSFINDMSDHDAEALTMNNIYLQKRVVYEIQYLRHIDSTTITDFQVQLTYETWDNIFEGSDVNILFNNFLNTCLKFYTLSLLRKNQI
jgi:hypothetical protein